MWRYELRLLRGLGWRGPAAGIDEAGRGPLAGPVFAAAVVLPRRMYYSGLDDSKRVPPARRAKLSESIQGSALGWAIAEVPVEHIDEHNILRASQEAMRRAWSALSRELEVAGALVDGLAVAVLGPLHLAVPGGDARCPSIAAASILAKVARDRRMVELDSLYPQYGFARHKGYATPEHLEALRRFGPCPAHRRSFGLLGRATEGGHRPRDGPGDPYLPATSSRAGATNRAGAHRAAHGSTAHGAATTEVGATGATGELLFG